MKIVFLFAITLLVIVLLSIDAEARGRIGGRVPSRGTGPSGQPKRHFDQSSNRKTAEDKARNAGKGNPPVEHPAHKPGQNPHFHPTDKKGNIRKDGSHYEYPKKG